LPSPVESAKKEAMGEGEGGGRGAELTGIGGSEPRDTLTLEGSPVEREVGVEDHRLVVLSAVLVEHVLGEEGETLGVPSIGHAEEHVKKRAGKGGGSVPRLGRGEVRK
jgi:hypothetical protein